MGTKKQRGDPRDREVEEVNQMTANSAETTGDEEGSDSRTSEKQATAQAAVAADAAGDKPAHHAAEAATEEIEMEDELEDIAEYTSRIKQAIQHHRKMAKLHEGMAQRLIDAAKAEGVTVHMEDDDDEDSGRRRRRRRHGQPGHNLAGEPSQPGGQGRVTDPDKDKRVNK